MLRLLADENFNNDIVRGLQLRRQDLDLVRVQDLPIIGQDDPTVLQWAADKNRILLTHDRNTIPAYALKRLDAGQHMPGIFIMSDRLAVGQAIAEILLLVECTEQAEWLGQIAYLPI